LDSRSKYATFARTFLKVEQKKLNTMGRGDKRSRKGKIWRNSYGKKRPKGGKKKVVAVVAEKAAE